MPKINTKDKSLQPEWYIAKKVIRAHGITQERLAEMMGLSTTSVHDIVNYCPSILHVKRMADATGIPFAEFFDWSHPDIAYQMTPKSPEYICPKCGTRFSVM